jgi:hypothetical protein
MHEEQQLYNAGIISEEQLKNIQQYETTKLFSLHWELRTILYLGILLLITGIGILVYLNIDSIGHQAVLGAIALACGSCFYYAHKNRLPYTTEKLKHASPFFDYVVILGCLLFGVFIGYIHAQYTTFSYSYILTTALTALLFFYSAYLFDNLPALSLAITALASCIGLSVTPLELLTKNDFSTLTLLFAAMALGIVLAGGSTYLNRKNIKTHFTFTYHNFAAHLLFIATLTALFNEPYKALSFLLLAAVTGYFIKYAIAKESFMLLLFSCVYSYIGLTYCFFSLLSSIDSMNEGLFLIGSVYVMASCYGIVMFFINYKKILKTK